jgi:hypothetical protein
MADDNLISAKGAYAKDRAALEDLLSITLDRYGISIESAASGAVAQAPVIPDLTAPSPPPPPKPLKPFSVPAPPTGYVACCLCGASWFGRRKVVRLDTVPIVSNALYS